MGRGEPLGGGTVVSAGGVVDVGGVSTSVPVGAAEVGLVLPMVAAVVGGLVGAALVAVFPVPVPVEESVFAEDDVDVVVALGGEDSCIPEPTCFSSVFSDVDVCVRAVPNSSLALAALPVASPVRVAGVAVAR